jgi:hypothetical protein
MGDRAEVHSGAQKVSSCAVNGVRVEAFVFKRWVSQHRFLNVFMQDETYTKAGQPGATIIKEHRSRGVGRLGVLLN